MVFSFFIKLILKYYENLFLLILTKSAATTLHKFILLVLILSQLGRRIFPKQVEFLAEQIPRFG